MEYIKFILGILSAIISLSKLGGEQPQIKYVSIVSGLFSLYLFISSYAGVRNVDEIKSDFLRQGQNAGNIFIDTRYDIDDIEYVKIWWPPANRLVVLPNDNYEKFSKKSIKIKSIIGDDFNLNSISAQNGCEIGYQTHIFIFNPAYIDTIKSKRLFVKDSNVKYSRSMSRFFGVVNRE